MKIRQLYYYIIILLILYTNLITAQQKTLKIMPLGDSITEGYFADPLIVRNSYRKKLKELLEKSGLNFDFVGSLSDGDFPNNEHEGHAGYSAKYWYPPIPQPDIYSNITTYLSAHPDIILFHIGTNDINDFRYSHETDIINITVNDVSDILDLIYSFNPNIKVILAKIINRTDETVNTPTFNESLATSQFNIALVNMASERSEFETNLFLVDMESALTYPTDLQDLLHPNQIGYDKMAPVWLNGIKTILPKISAKVFLEGAYSGLSNMESNENFFTAIPEDQPFKLFPWYFEGTEHVDQTPENVIDWVLVSLRSDETKSSTKAQRAGFIKENGTIVDLDGESPLAFAVDEGMYYVVVEHRNHLPIMSSEKVLIQP